MPEPTLPDYTPGGPSYGPEPISDLERERLRLQTEITALEARQATTTDEVDQIRISNSLEKLRSDYRQILIAVKPSTQAPGTAPTSKTHTITNADGSTDTYTYKFNGKEFVLDTSIPVERKPAAATPAANRPPTDPSKWVPIRANPADPSSRIIGLQDPQNSSNRVTVTADSSATRPTVVDGERGQKFSWDGTSLKELIPASPEKRQVVQGQGGAIYSWDGQNLTSIQPGQYQPQNGDTMSDVVQGNYVTKTFQNGQWGVTNVGKSALPGLEEGRTRQIIQNGYNTTQTRDGNEWVTTSMGSKATPEKPSQLQAPSDQANLLTLGDGGQIGQQTNPNFIPKTQAEVNARVGQIQQAMQAKKAEVTSKVSQTYTEEQALRDYNTWYAQNVAPQQATLQAAQNDAALERAKAEAKMRGDAYQQALGAGTLNVSAFNAMREANPIGNPEAYSSVMNQIGAKMGLSGLGEAFTYQAPNPMETAQSSVNEALKQISGGAAAAPGMPPPNFGGMDLNAALSRDLYTAPGIPSPAPAAAAAAANGGPPPTLPADPSLAPPWQRADQMAGGAPPGNAMIPQPGGMPAGWVPPGSPQYLGMLPKQPWAFAPSYSVGG